MWAHVCIMNKVRCLEMPYIELLVHASGDILHKMANT